MSFQPIRDLIAAARARDAGDLDAAGQLLARAVGVEKPTIIMEQNLHAMIENDAVIALAIHESEKGR